MCTLLLWCFGQVGKANDCKSLMHKFNSCKHLKKYFMDRFKRLKITDTTAGRIMLYNEGHTFVESPTYNCQLFSIGGFDNIIGYYKTKTISAKEIFQHILNVTSKSIVLLDINEEHVKDTLEIFKEADSIILNYPYKSSNGSNMVILMIQLFPTNSDLDFDENEDSDVY